jgi:hypothetical protein
VHLLRTFANRSSTHPQIGFAQHVLPTTTRVNTDNGVCHCCAASPCSAENGLRNVNAPGMCRPCDIVINRVGRSEEALLQGALRLFPCANNTVNDKGLIITVGSYLNHVFREDPGNFSKSSKPFEQLLRIRILHRVKILHRFELLHRVTVLPGSHSIENIAQSQVHRVREDCTNSRLQSWKLDCRVTGLLLAQPLRIRS